MDQRVCRKYLMSVTFLTLNGAPLYKLRNDNPTATYSLHYQRGHRKENSDHTANMRIDDSGQITWNKPFSFFLTVTEPGSQPGERFARKFLDMTLYQVNQGKAKPTPIGTVSANLSSYCMSDKLHKKYAFALSLYDDKEQMCALKLEIRSEPQSVPIPERFVTDFDTTIGSEDEGMYDSTTEYSDADVRSRSRSVEQPYHPQPLSARGGGNTSRGASPREVVAPMLVSSQPVPKHVPTSSTTPTTTPRTMQQQQQKLNNSNNNSYSNIVPSPNINNNSNNSLLSKSAPLQRNVSPRIAAPTPNTSFYQQQQHSSSHYMNPSAIDDDIRELKIMRNTEEKEYEMNRRHRETMEYNNSHMVSLIQTANDMLENETKQNMRLNAHLKRSCECRNCVIL